MEASWFFKKCLALAGVAQWIECQPANQKLEGLIPHQGNASVSGPGSQLWACGEQQMDVPLAH